LQYILTFLEGIITFISPCLLPMLPVYVLYFAGSDNSDGTRSKKTLVNSFVFVAGFTLVFILMGALAGTIGKLLIQQHTALNIITGLIVIIFGLNYIGLFKIGFLNNTHRIERSGSVKNILSAFVFGIVFSIGWTPCIGPFLGSALMKASQQASVLQGILMLLVYSAGLGIPFILSAVLLDKLKNAFDFIKKHYRIINIISGSLLIIVGILMMTGYIGRIQSLLG